VWAYAHTPVFGLLLFRDLLNMVIIKDMCNFALAFNTHSDVRKLKTPLLAGEFSRSVQMSSIEVSVLFAPSVIDSTNAADLFGDGGGAIVADRPCA
jgi:hypothetical protein